MNRFRSSPRAASLAALFIAGSTFLAAVHGAASPLPRLTAPVANEVLEIDGLADDAVWERGFVSYGFMTGDGGRPGADTRARVLYDRQALYVAFTAIEPALDDLRTRARGRRADVRGDDSVGVRLRLPTENGDTREVEIWVNAANRVHVIDASQRGGIREDLSTAVTKRGGSWDTEMAIPFAALGVEPPRPGDVWKADFIRHRRGGRGPDGEVSSWTGSDGWGEIRFGRDLLVYLWSQRPFAGRDEVMVYNDSDSLRQLEAWVVSVASGETVTRETIYLGPGHRRQHFPLPAYEPGEYRIIVRATDCPMQEDDVLLVVRRPRL
ncbi:MAG: hypothetical protein JJU00_04385 [Opitutales bacterium]|nr:hypothetical protein [Opitutales bacterium]